MLNRRILRIKAMQALYAHVTNRESLKRVVKDGLVETFTPNALTHDMSDTFEIDEHRKIAKVLYDENLEEGSLKSKPASTPDEVADEVRKAIANYYGEVSRNLKSVRKAMLTQTKELQNTYHKFLLLPSEFQFIEKQDQEKKETALINKEETWFYHLQANPLIEAITTTRALQKEVTAKNLSWQEDVATLRTWYKDLLKKDESWIAYQKNPKPTPEDHLAILKRLFKKILFSNETINAYWEEKDIHWSENSGILRSMLVKTIQDFNAEAEEPIQLKTISLNEEDDFEFFEVIFDTAVDQETYFETLITEKTKNWDISRLAKIDVVIIKMALGEMIACRSIPVKVTINEYIEICKLYSTPKSKQFVNGILDVLANQLTSEGVIRKTGRGLIDNH